MTPHDAFKELEALAVTWREDAMHDWAAARDSHADRYWHDGARTAYGDMLREIRRLSSLCSEGIPATKEAKDGR